MVYFLSKSRNIICNKCTRGEQMAAVSVEITQESGFRCFDVKYVEISADGKEIGEEKAIDEICRNTTLTLSLDSEKRYELRFYRKIQFPWTFFKFLRIAPKEGAEASFLILLSSFTIKNAEEITTQEKE